MANITDYLKQILSARYGRDVRQSIHDAIHQCYEDGKAGSTDLEAREEIQATNEVVHTVSGAVEAIKTDLGDEDISDIGDGTVTGAVRHLADRPSGGGDSSIWISKAEYEALSEEEQNTGTYDIYDMDVNDNAYTLPFTSELYEAENVGDALVEAKEEIDAIKIKYLDTTITTDSTYGIGAPAALPPTGGRILSIVAMTANRPVLRWYYDGSTYQVAIGTSAGAVPEAGTYSIRIFYISY